jgi:hypothetical protein
MGYGLSAEANNNRTVEEMAMNGASGFSVSQQGAREAFQDAVIREQNDGLQFDDNDLGWFCSYASNPGGSTGEFYSLSSARVGDGVVGVSQKDGTLEPPSTPAKGVANGFIDSALTATVYFRHSVGGERGTKDSASTNYTVSAPTVSGAGVSVSAAPRQASKTGTKTGLAQQNVYGDDGNGVFTVTFSNPATTSATICQSITYNPKVPPLPPGSTANPNAPALPNPNAGGSRACATIERKQVQECRPNIPVGDPRCDTSTTPYYAELYSSWVQAAAIKNNNVAALAREACEYGTGRDTATKGKLGCGTSQNDSVSSSAPVVYARPRDSIALRYTGLAVAHNNRMWAVFHVKQFN